MGKAAGIGRRPVAAMNGRLSGHLKAMPPWAVVVLGLALVAVVGVADGVSGPQFSFSAFYLIPVVFTAWFAGRGAGIAVAVAGAVAWLAADVAGKSYHKHALTRIWNDAVELSLFLSAAFVISALRGRLEREEEQARTDQLTGIANRRRFNELAGDEIRRSRRYRNSFSVMYIDIDNFKVVNDTMGHSEGDRLLRQVAATIGGSIRESDTVARLGGDEFALLLPEAGGDAARSVAAKLRERLKAEVESRWPVTFSIGMVTYLDAPATVDDMIRRADLLMYEVKGSGKDELRHEVVAGGEGEQVSRR